jgi:hypothetical protein
LDSRSVSRKSPRIIVSIEFSLDCVTPSGEIRVIVAVSHRIVKGAGFEVGARKVFELEAVIGKKGSARVKGNYHLLRIHSILDEVSGEDITSIWDKSQVDLTTTGDTEFEVRD